MRDKKRIPLVLKEIERIWEEFPDVRFNQLLDTLDWKYKAENDVKDLFYLEDDKYLDWLKTFSLKKGSE